VVQRAERLLGCASSSIEEETTYDEILELFLTQLKALKILNEDTPEETKRDMEAYFHDIIKKNKEFSKDTGHAYSPNNF
jgi:thiamine phosphate synthase YjbQ (UPF0047 family)